MVNEFGGNDIMNHGLFGPSSDQEPLRMKSEALQDTVTGTRNHKDTVSLKSISPECNGIHAPTHSAEQDPGSKASDRDVLNSEAAPRLSAAHQVPVEILQQIYHLLGAKDFNSARHTCRSWLRSSLDEELLLSMLNRGGWTSWDYTADCPNVAWSLSKSLSRECSLSSGVASNGIDKRPLFTEVSNIDFSGLKQKGNTRSQPSGLLFTPSTCGDYVLVARDTRIFVYSLQSGSLDPMTSVVCPRRVVSMSMDVSSSRHAVAALLESRMGIVCELRYDEAVDEMPVEAWVESDGETAVESSSSTVSDTDSESTDDFAGTTPGSFYEIHVLSACGRVSLPGLRDLQMFDSHLICQTWPMYLRGRLKDSTIETCTRRIAVEKGMSTIYRHVCSEDDLPRSVSVRAGHYCVAFGCSKGIEVHWMDATTMQSLSRRFSLTAPSDYLHFLQPRLGLESARRLRLISSAAYVSSPALSSDRSKSRRRICGGFGSLGQGHYHAVPLSDGHHILFLDPINQVLTLGCDGPPDRPVKLLRKIMLLPPRGGGIASIYNAATDMSWGARIAVAYGDTIVLYSIPPDVLDVSCFEHETQHSLRAFILEREANSHWLDWHDHESLSPDADSIWPLAIRGTEVGKLGGVCELVVQTVPGVSVWAFSKTAQCKSWRLGGYAGAVGREGFVCRGGVVHGRVDGHGECSEQVATVGLDDDGSSELRRMPRALAVEKDGAVEDVDVRGCLDAWYEEDGDVVVKWCDGQGEMRG